MHIDFKNYGLFRLSTKPQKSAKKFGKFHVISTIFGGLLITYLILALLFLLLPNNLEHNMLIIFLSFGFVWAIISFWLSLCITKLEITLKILTLLAVCLVAILYFYES